MQNHFKIKRKKGLRWQLALYIVDKTERNTTMKRKIKFEDDEIRVLIIALIELRNKLIEDDRYTDAVDDLIIKLS